MQIIPFHHFPHKKLNIKAYCRRSWGGYYQEKIAYENPTIETLTPNSPATFKSRLIDIYQTTLAERYGIKAVYIIATIVLLYLIHLIIIISTELRNEEYFPFVIMAIPVLWIYAWFTFDSVMVLIGKRAWWINPFTWYQIFWYHKIIFDFNQINANQWQLCLCPVFYKSKRKSFSRQRITYISHYAYYQKNKLKKLPIYPIADNHTLFWLIDDCILCVCSPNKQIPLPLDKQLNCIRGLSANEKEILRQKIIQAVENIVVSQQEPPTHLATDNTTNTTRRDKAGGFCRETTMTRAIFRQPETSV